MNPIIEEQKFKLKHFLLLVSVFFSGLFAVLLLSFFLLKIRPNLFAGRDEIPVKPKEYPLLKYSYENLEKRVYEAVPITLGEIVNEQKEFTSRIFYFISDGKKISGLINIPNGKGVYPVIVQFRGWAPLETYQSGVGTQHSGEVFVKNGFITLAPDFLGYGESDAPSDDVFEGRFETYTTALDLLSSIKNLNESLISSGIDGVTAYTEKVGIWAHSNGGQIALTVLEVTGRDYPTTLWSPVSKPFPYNVLFYTDESDDNGKFLRRALADFEKDYDAEKYSLTNYFDQINASIQLHQGTDDEAVPLRWSDLLYRTLKDKEKKITYFTYPGADHNFSGDSWNTVVARNIAFFREQLNISSSSE